MTAVFTRSARSFYNRSCVFAATIAAKFGTPRRSVLSKSGSGFLYPPLAAGKSGLAKKLFALIDDLRSVEV
jgi:hypothetical protein